MTGPVLQFPNVPQAKDNIYALLGASRYPVPREYIDYELDRQQAIWDKEGPTAFLEHLNVNSGYGVAGYISQSWEQDGRTQARWAHLAGDLAGANGHATPSDGTNRAP